MVEQGVTTTISLEHNDEGWFVYARFDGADYLNSRIGPYPSRSDAELVAQHIASVGRKLGAVDIPEGKPN